MIRVLINGKLMKRLASLLLLICFILLPGLNNTEAQVQVMVKLRQPLYNQLRSTDIWNLGLSNLSGKTLQIILAGTLEEGSARIIVERTSKHLSLPPGTKQITYDDVKTGNVNFKTGKWQELVHLQGMHVRVTTLFAFISKIHPLKKLGKIV